MDLMDFLRVLLRRKWLILAITSIALITTFLIARKTPKVYRVSARIATGITQNNQSTFSIDSEKGKARFEIEASFKNMEIMIQSPQVLELVSYQLMLHDLDKTEPFRPLTEISKSFTDEELQVARRRYKLKRDAIESLNATDELERKHIEILRLVSYDYESIKKGLDVRRIPGTDYIGVEYFSENPYLSAFVVNILSQEFIRFYSHTKTDREENSIKFFADMVSEKKTELDDKMKSWENYKKIQGVSEVSNPTKDIVSRINQLEEIRENANQKVFVSEKKLIELEEAIGGEGKTPFLEGELTRGTSLNTLLRNRMIRLNNKYVRTGMNNDALLDSLKRIQGELSTELFQTITEDQKITDPNKKTLVQSKIDEELEIELARSRITAIDRELTRLSSQAGNFTSQEDGTSSYGKEVEVARDAYLLVLNKYNRAKIAAQEPTHTAVSQAEFVQPPEKPEPSKAFLLVILSGLVSLALCIAVLFFLEYLDNTIKFPSQFTKLTGLEMLGPLNRLTNTNLDLVTLFDEVHKNNSLENFKQLLRKIRYEVVSQGPKTLLITSTKAGSGKTSLLVSLAYSLSLNKKKVLLIDTNFKSNSLTQITGASPSLEKYLNKEVPKRGLISNSVFEGVDVIGCEGGVHSPSEVFKEEDFENLLFELADQYDHILMEGPMLNTFSDSKELVRYSAKVLPIFAADEGINEMDISSVEYLKTLKKEGKLMGSVLNKVEIRNLNQ